jgi:hypothetical protein
MTKRALKFAVILYSAKRGRMSSWVLADNLEIAKVRAKVMFPEWEVQDVFQDDETLTRNRKYEQ